MIVSERKIDRERIVLTSV